MGGGESKHARLTGRRERIAQGPAKCRYKNLDARTITVIVSIDPVSTTLKFAGLTFTR